MKNQYAPTLLTPEIIEQLDPEKNYVLCHPVTNEPNNVVKKDWLERIPNCYYILWPITKIKSTDLFGETLSQEYFKATTHEKDDGWLMMFCSGRSSADNKDWCVTTDNLKSDEIPDECTDAKTFAELVAKLLNQYYNQNK